MRPDGSVVIKLSSREALKEPFLGLLLEVSWPKGSLYREFSVLVDPPEVYEQATVPVVNLPERFDTPPVYPSPGETAVSDSPRKIRRSTEDTDSYGPTTRRDTLWKIAEQTGRQYGVSVEQMMIALYRENPRAFFKENINALKAGKTLKIPPQEAIVKLSRKQALAEYDRQTEIWKNRSAPAPVETAQATSQETDEKRDQAIDNQLTLVAPAEAAVSENAVIIPGQEQTAAEQNGTQTASKTVGDSSGNNSSETGTGTNSDIAALQSKMLEMQQQLAKMQEVMALKDQQIAALQHSAEPKPAAPTPAQAAPQPAESVSSAVTQPAAQTPPANQQPVVGTTPAQKVPPKTKRPPVQQPSAQNAAASDSGSFYLTASGIGFTLLSGMVWLWWRKRKTDAKTDTESMFAPSIITRAVDAGSSNRSAAPAAAQSIDDSNIYQVDSVGESSFLSEFTPSDFDAFDTDQGEIDPVSEADVYLAYGRYQQAEDLMRQAILDQPNRDECKLKLLEIFFASENGKGFDAYAMDLAAAGKQDDKGFWEKVAEMGRELCPGSTLFAAGEKRTSIRTEKEDEQPAVQLNKNVESDLSALDVSDVMELDGPVFDTAPLMDSSATDSAKFESGVADFDFSLSDLADHFDREDTQANNEALDFDLDSISTLRADSPAGGRDENPAESLIEAEESNKDFDFNLLDFTLEPRKSSKESSDAFAPDLTAGKESSDQAQESLALDGDFNFNFDLSEEEAKHGEFFGVSDLTDMDEFETKLDLARAYLDMGDEASAKEIVEQVIEKGSEEQKKMALKFFDVLS